MYPVIAIKTSSEGTNVSLVHWTLLNDRRFCSEHQLSMQCFYCPLPTHCYSACPPPSPGQFPLRAVKSWPPVTDCCKATMHIVTTRPQFATVRCGRRCSCQLFLLLWAVDLRIHTTILAVRLRSWCVRVSHLNTRYRIYLLYKMWVDNVEYFNENWYAAV